MSNNIIYIVLRKLCHANYKSVGEVYVKVREETVYASYEN